MDSSGVAARIQGGLLEAQGALSPPPSFLPRLYSGCIALYALCCITSVALLLVARKQRDFFLVKLRNNFLCPHSSFAFLLFNALSTAAMVAYCIVIRLALSSPERRIQLHPYAWLGCVWVAPYITLWASWTGGIVGLFLLPSTSFVAGRDRRSIFFTKVAPMLWNIFCLGVPVALLAVTIPLALRLSRPATGAYVNLRAVYPILQQLNASLTANGTLGPGDLPLAVQALQLGNEIGAQLDGVAVRWHDMFWVWTGWLAGTLAIYVPTFVILLRSLRRAYRPLSSPAPSEISTPEVEKRALDFHAAPADSEKLSPPLPVLSKSAAVQTAGSSSFQDDFARADDTRRRQRYVLWRTAALFAAQLVCALVYFGFLCWLANIDPVRVSANTSAIAYAISILSYACASIAAVCTIAVRLYATQQQAKQDRALTASAPSLSLDVHSKRVSRGRDVLDESPVSPFTPTPTTALADR